MLECAIRDGFEVVVPGNFTALSDLREQWNLMEILFLLEIDMGKWFSLG